MKLFELLEAIISIIKTRISTVNTENIYNYEPGEGMPDVRVMPALFIYENETNFQKSDSDNGSQSHDPDIYIDVYVAEKATKSQSSGTIVYSVKKAHAESRLILTDLYNNCLMWQPFRAELEKIIDTTGGAQISRLEKLGVAKYPESSISIVAYRFIFRSTIEEEPQGDDGIDFDQVQDCVIPVNSKKGNELWP